MQELLEERQNPEVPSYFLLKLMKLVLEKANRTIADLRYEEKDIIIPSTLIFAPIKGLLGIYTLHIASWVL